MRRREFIALFAAAWSPHMARAEQGTIPVVGFLNGGVAKNYGPLAAAFVKGLAEAGYVEG